MMDTEGACAQLPEFAVPREIPRFGIVRAALESISRYHAVLRACQNLTARRGGVLMERGENEFLEIPENQKNNSIKY